MPRFALSIALALGSALALALACGSDGDSRKQGAEGVADAFYELAEHECHCIAASSGFGSQVENACREQIGDIEEFFPLSCIEGVIDRHPEARQSYDCAARITYDYVDCLVGEGCEERFQCEGGGEISVDWVCDGYDDCDGGEDEAGDCMPFSCRDGTEIAGSERCDGVEDCADGEDEPADCPQTCDMILQSAATQCPQPPEDIRDEIEACFASLACEGGSDIPEELICEGEAD